MGGGSEAATRGLDGDATMPRIGGYDDEKYKRYRDLCIAIDIVTLARRRYLTPGWHEGDVELLAEEALDWWPTTQIRALMQEKEGVLTVFFPVEQDLPMVRLETPCGPRWKFVCPGHTRDDDFGEVPCERLTRTLLVPRTPPGISGWWGCRSCLHVVYRRRRDLAREARLQLEDLQQLRAQIDVLERVTRMDWEEFRRK
jgi:hypothetical protein